MLKQLKHGASAIVIGAGLAVGGLGIGAVQAELTPELQAQVSNALATGTDAQKVQALMALAQANPEATADIAAAASSADPNLADDVAGPLAAQLSTQDEKNALVRTVCMALGDSHEDIALEICTQVVAAVPGSEGVLQDLIQTAAGGPFGDPTPEAPGEPVGPDAENQTSNQIPFYKLKGPRPETSSPINDVGYKGEPPADETPPPPVNEES